MFKYFSICLLFIFLSGVSYANDKTSSAKISDRYPNKQLNFLLPINAALAKDRLNLAVKIPEHFVRVQNNPPRWKGVFEEFIPKSDTSVNEWTQIITVHSWIGYRISAVDFINNFRESISTPTTKIISHNKRKHHAKGNKKNYLMSSLMLKQYDSSVRRIVVMYVQYYSGPYDMSGFQYSIVLNDKMTEKKAIEIIKSFVSKNISIIKF